jgi:hypothetical protein
MLRRVPLVRTEVAHYVTSNKTEFFIVTALKPQILQNLKGSKDGVEHSELLGYRTLSIVLNSKN